MRKVTLNNYAQKERKKIIMLSRKDDNSSLWRNICGCYLFSVKKKVMEKQHHVIYIYSQ